MYHQLIDEELESRKRIKLSQKLDAKYSEIAERENRRISDLFVSVDKIYKNKNSSINEKYDDAVEYAKNQHFIAKEEFYNSAFFRWLLPRLGVIGVNRDNIDLSTIRKVVGVLKSGEILGIFPEGTRNKDASDESMLKVKHGTAMFAVRGGAKVLPVYIYRRPKFFRRTYMYIGKPIDLASMVSGPLTAEKLGELADVITKGMESAKEYLSEVMREKRYGKEVRAEKKRMKQRRKEQKRAGADSGARAGGDDT